MRVRSKEVPEIFISYRRAETAGFSGRLFEHVKHRFGHKRVFMDVEGGVERGSDFPKKIAEALHSSTAMLVVIGPRWLDSTDKEGKQRLNNEDDWVRKEIAFGLKQDIAVFPVLVDGATMPTPGDLPADIRGLTDKQWSEIRNDNWDRDVAEIIKALEKFIPRRNVGTRIVWTISAAVTLVALVVVMWSASDEKLNRSNVIEVLSPIGVSDIHLSKESERVLGALDENGIKTKRQLQALVNHPFIIAKLKEIYVDELKRDRNAPLDGVALAVYGSYLLKNDATHEAEWEVRKIIRQSDEYPGAPRVPMPQGGFPDGEILKGDGPTLYMVEKGVKRPLPDLDTWEWLNYKRPLHVHQTTLEKIPAGKPLPSMRKNLKGDWVLREESLSP